MSTNLFDHAIVGTPEQVVDLVTKLERENIELMRALEQLGLQATALETAADAILITDADGVILWVNRAFTSVTGYDAEEAIGKTPRILKSGLQDEAFYRKFWSTIRAGRTWRGEFTNRRKNGELYYDEHTVTPVLGDDGSVTHFVGVMQDITERKHAETQLRDAHEQLQVLLDHSPAVLYALKVAGDTFVPRLASQNIVRLLGFEVAETLSDEWWSGQVHPADLQRARASVTETLTDGFSRSEYRIRHKNGTYRWVEDNRRLVGNAPGGRAEIVGAWTDITEQKRAQDELRESERRIREMLDNLELVSIMLDRDGRVTYCNDNFLLLTGWRREDVLSVDWFERFVPPEQIAERRELFASQLSERPYARHYTNEILTRAGERRLLRWNNSVLRSAAGDVIGTASVAEDITDRKKLEEQFLRAQRMESLGTLAGGIAHDLNNLFMPILMGVTFLKRLPLDEKSIKAIQNIEVSVKRGTDLVQQVLLFARGSDVARKAMDVRGIVAEVQAIVHSTFAKNITFTTTMPNTLRSVLGDATQLNQVLLNLCVNARDAMPGGGQIVISASNIEIDAQYAAMHGGATAGSYVVIEVADSGTGMSKGIMDRIFDPFFTTKDVSKGTGLGLSTVLGIVRGHGGFIEVSSEVGKGSAFRVYLPSSIGTESAEVVEGVESEQFPTGHGEVILVVDDEVSILTITKDTLESFGYSVWTAEDGAQAIGLFARDPAQVAAVLTDMMMPIMDGSALISALRRIDATVPVIAMSGYGEGNQLGRATRAGATHFLSKPYSAKVLLRTLSHVLRPPQ